MSKNNLTIAIIPARMASSRFPGKPMEKIQGMPLIEHVYKRTTLVKNIDSVIVATCDEVIYKHISNILTPREGTDQPRRRCIGLRGHRNFLRGVLRSRSLD